MTLRHVTLTVAHMRRSLAFYDAVLAPLDLVRGEEYADEEEDPADAPIDAVGYGPDGAAVVLWLAAGRLTTVGAHLAFDATSRAAVDEFFTAALGHGGAPRHAPRRWELYRPGYYGALVTDPDGNLVEAFATE
jgi:catechol 2,3-dioxygenase-like lactoylglutathione lyase family enzyme